MTRRTFTYAAVWAVLTVLAAVVVWWGLGPLLTPIMQSAASPPQSPSPSHVSPTPVVSIPPSAAKPRPSTFEGWQYADGMFTQTFTVDGGQATVRITGGRVELVSSQAANGYGITPGNRRRTASSWSSSTAPTSSCSTRCGGRTSRMPKSPKFPEAWLS